MRRRRGGLGGERVYSLRVDSQRTSSALLLPLASRGESAIARLALRGSARQVAARLINRPRQLLSLSRASRG